MSSPLHKLARISLCLLPFISRALTADDWPQWRGPKRDGVWREKGILEKFDSSQVKLRWKVPISGGYSGPTVAHGRVYVSDRVVEPRELERVHCLEWETGKRVWSYGYNCKYGKFGYRAGPRASVLIDDGRAYSLGAAGHLYCFEAAGGKVLWKKDLGREYEIRIPNWGVSASPVIEDQLLIAQIGGKGNACVVAFDKESGKEVWRALPDDASYSAPRVIDQGSQRVLVCWTGLRIAGLDPTTGKVYWEYPWRYEKWPIAISDPIPCGDKLFFSESHKGSLLLRLLPDRLAVEKVWHRRKEDGQGAAALHCLQSTATIDGDSIYGVGNYGVLRCLELKAGDQVWESQAAVPRARWATMHLVRNGDRTWLFNERGELIIARLSPKGFEEISRAKLIDPTTEQLRRRGGVTWSHPGFAYRHVFARNDKELVCADLSAPGP